MKDDWEELIRSDFCLYNVSIALHSIQFSNEFLKGPKYQKLLLYIKDDIGYYYENFNDHFMVGEHCLKLFLENKRLFDDYLKFWNDIFEKLNLLLFKIRKTDLTKLSKDELANLLEKVYHDSIYWEGVAYNVDAIDTTLNPIIKKLIKKIFPDKKKSGLTAVYNRLTFPDILSYMNRINLERLGLLIRIKEKGFNKCKKDINRFIKDYYWVNFTWGESPEYTAEDIIKETKNSDLDVLKKDLENTKARIKKSLKEKKQLIKEISKKDFKIVDYIKIFDAYTILHDLRKEGQVKSVDGIRSIYKEISRRTKIKLELLYYLWPMEVVESLRKDKSWDKDLMETRSKGYFCEYYHDRRIIEFYGEEASKMKDKVLSLNIDKTQKELLGIGVSQGRIIGKAKVCLSSHIANKKIKKGDILITGMTMPEFVPAMKKAAAIVTDEGGLTCHAAIIARELGIPCVTGTKMATRLINDNDTIEVNANHGVVKIIR